MYDGAMGTHKWQSWGPPLQESEHDLKAGLPPRGSLCTWKRVYQMPRHRRTWGRWGQDSTRRKWPPLSNSWGCCRGEEPKVQNETACLQIPTSHLLAVWACMRHLTSLCLRFPTVKWGWSYGAQPTGTTRAWLWGLHRFMQRVYSGDWRTASTRHW